MTELVAGFLALLVPGIIIGVIVLGRTRPVFLMYLAALVVGLGYLGATGALNDIGKQALAQFDGGTPAPNMAPKAQPTALEAPQPLAPEAAPAEAPAAPAPAPAPAEAAPAAPAPVDAAPAAPQTP